ncbi:MAG: hypothetical protein FJY29_04155 [Betaproteobacteria bacterium]|nr:hypothetical protein [Betaproteobacteria bacterium]
MQNLLGHLQLGSNAHQFFQDVIERFPHVFRERELHWQIKMMSRLNAERDFFESCVARKNSELKLLMPYVSIAQVPPLRSTPLRAFVGGDALWPNPVTLLTQVFLQQILSSSDLFLDLGSGTDAFFVTEDLVSVVWVPDTRGTRWHEPFRSELARLYLGWAFEQERLVEMALLSLHLSPLRDEIFSVLEHWKHTEQRNHGVMREKFLRMFGKADALGMHVHPNLLIWALYEIEIVEVLNALDLKPDIERCADELCRSQSQISA